MRLLIVCAMLEENEPIRAHFKAQRTERVGHMTMERGHYQQADLCLVEAGIGKANAAMATTWGIEGFQPDVILNYGVVGGLADDLAAGDIIIPDDFCYHDADDTAFGSPLGQIPRMPHTYPLDSRLLDVVDQLTAMADHIKQGQCLTSDAFVYRQDHVNFIKDHFPKGIIVDMEATAIAQVAYTFDLPFLSIKTLSDHHKDDQAAEEYLQAKDQVALEAVDILFEVIDLLIKGEML